MTVSVGVVIVLLDGGLFYFKRNGAEFLRMRCEMRVTMYMTDNFHSLISTEKLMNLTIVYSRKDVDHT
jgi:hypothetical protein